DGEKVLFCNSVFSGLIDDYKNLHGNASAPGTSSASQWQPPSYHSGRAFAARYPRPSRRGFSSHHGPAWRKKYSLVNRPLGSSEPAGDHAVQAPLKDEGSQDPDPQPYVLERQVQLSPDQNMVIKIKPPSKSGSISTLGAQRSSLEDYEDMPWSDQRPQEGEGEPPVGKLQPLRPGRGRGSYSAKDPLLVCQKEPGKPRVVKSVGSVNDGPAEPRRTVSESAVVVQACLQSSILPPRTGMALGRKVGPHSAASCAVQPLRDERVNAGHPDQPAPLGSVVAPARSVSGPRQARETSLLVSCRTNKFRKSNYKWVASSAKSPRATRRSLSPRAATENVSRASFGTSGKTEKPQPRADPEARPRRLAMNSKTGPSPSKYKWKASSPSASSSSSFRWQSEAGSKDHASQLSPVPSRSPPGDRPVVGPGSLKPLFGETPLSAYKVKSRTKIVRRRGSTSLPGDKKNGPSPATTKSHLNLRRRQVLRGKNNPVLKRTPNKGLVQVTRHRLCHLPPSRAHLPSKEVAGMHTLRTSPASKVIKTRYRIVKKTPASSLSAPPFTLSSPSWRARRLSLSRSMVPHVARTWLGALLSILAPPGSPRWGKGYRCIGGVMYKVSANKLSKTASRPGDGGPSPLPATGRMDPTSSCSRSHASRAIQRSLAIIRQARQKREKRKEYCMYYNRFGRCNHGERCPYIHDPEKVAVCTRFVRGTCKKTDGTCPFSHHVSKEKMPVCSYFLKGICSNSDCPYSHVYVSRKAEVCSDFLKGYCPLGAKCKKKHTLLCPDFARRGACPRGTLCQLLHRNQKRHGRRAATPPTPGPSETTLRSRMSAGHAPRKPSATQRPTRQTPSSGYPAGCRVSSAPFPTAGLASWGAASSRTGSGSLCKLPSFISLQSSPSPGGHPGVRAPRGPLTKDSGRQPGCS
uniref:Zinc finger CCCH domain-containing protein 3 n=1 Tax=Spermophilus dauricus TaxID=99837 RepID=A0A8C9Q206_SPEDA